MLPTKVKQGRRERLQAAASGALLSLARAATEDWDESIQHIVEIDANVLGVERAGFWSVSEEAPTVHCDAGYVSSGDYNERGAAIITPDLVAYFSALHASSALDIEDVASDARVRAWRDYFVARDVVSVLHVPVWVESRLAGILCHEHVGSKRHFRRDQEEFAIGVAHLVGFALTARAKTRLPQRAVFLDSMSRMLLETRNMREVARRAADLLVPQTADLALVLTLNRHGMLDCLAHKDTNPARSELFGEVMKVASKDPVRARLLSLVLQNQAILVREFSDEVAVRYGITQVNDLLRKGELKTAIAVPLAAGGAPFGALMVFASDARYGSDELSLIGQVGERVASALENARLHELSREAIRVRDELLMLTAHELRTPMTALVLATKTALRQEENGDLTQQGGMETIARQVQRMSAVVERIVEALHIRVEGVVLSRERCDIARLVRNIVSERVRRNKPIELHAEEAIVGCWDPRALERTIRELLDNAVKFGEGKPIEISLKRDEFEAVLTVRDHGIEIPAERMASIFSPFERAVSKEHFGGLGLGLYISKAIAEEHGGSIEVTSNTAEGTTFVVRLPLGGR